MPGRKIKGRGAKITCPRCSHVFVIFSKDVEEDPKSPAAASPPETEQPQPAAPARNVTPPGPASISDHDSPAAGSQVPGSLRAEDIFGKGATNEAAPTTRTRGVRRRHRRPAGTPTTPVDPPPSPATPEASPAPSAPDTSFDMGTPLKAESLDFKAVGVTTWKVKVAIGLVYDFSDVQTLYRYIQEKKITPGDQISFDGTNWSPVGNDEELERFLLKVYSDKKREASGQEAAADAGTPTPSVTGAGAERRTPASSDTEASVSEDSSGAGSDPSASGFKVDLKKPPRHRTRKKAAGEPRIMGLKPPVFYGVALVGVVIVVVVIFALRGGPPATTTPAPGGGGQASGGAEDSSLRDEAREKIDRQLKEQQDRIREEEGGSDGVIPDGDEEFVADGTAQKINGSSDPETAPLEQVTPKDVTPEPEITPPAERDTPREEPVVERQEEKTPAPVEEPSTEEDDATADDWFMLGDMALASGNCNEAIGHLKLAVSMNPSNSTFNFKLGQAYHQCGQDGAAKGPLKKAASTYPDAQKLLDQIEGN